MKYLDYDIKNGTHRTAVEEWAPHKALAPNFFEWHYFTSPMTGANGHQYFIFLCDFNFSSDGYKNAITKGHPEQLPEGLSPYLNSMHFCDYTSDLYRTDTALTLSKPEDNFDEAQNALTLKAPQQNFDVNFSYKGDDIFVYAKTNTCEFELKCTGGNHVMWMQDKLGKEGFIQEGTENERSFYYSLPKLPYHGWLKYTDDDGKEIVTDVYGQGWIDRQWGDFDTKTWEWTSFRFGDGDRINTYNFGNGYQVATYQKADGSVEHFPKFKVVQNSYIRSPNNIWVSWGWDYYIPVKDKHYKLVPLSDKNFIGNHVNTLYEGLSRIINDNGEQVGWAVTESMDVREMNNAPYAPFNNFPD